MESIKFTACMDGCGHFWGLNDTAHEKCPKTLGSMTCACLCHRPKKKIIRRTP